MSLPLPYPDAEQVAMDLLSVLARTVSWLPPDSEFEVPIIHVQRIGGGPDAYDLTDYALMRVAYYGATRNAAWTLAGEGDSVLLGHRAKQVDRPGRPSDGVCIDTVDIEVGGTLDPDLDPDDRRVVKNYTIGMRRQYRLLTP